jgi:adenylate cyclase
MACEHTSCYAPSMEIERKFLLSQAPDRARLGAGAHIAQGYLPFGMRLRREDERCTLTVKGEGTLVRDEWEVAIPEWVFDQLWSATAGRRLEKTRYTVPHGDLMLEVDEYHGPLAGLWTLECEFVDEQQVGTLRLPDWAATAEEVTEDRRYRNVSLAEHGLP